MNRCPKRRCSCYLPLFLWGVDVCVCVVSNEKSQCARRSDDKGQDGALLAELTGRYYGAKKIETRSTIVTIACTTWGRCQILGPV